MITSFQNDGINIPLSKSPSIGPDNRSLFAADTMTLLVGPNGSGKTRAMTGLISALARRGSPDTPASITWNNEEGFDSTCAVYYTSAPYHLPGPKKGNQYRLIKTSLSNTDKPLTPEHKDIIDQLKSTFGLEARKNLTLSQIHELEISHLLSQLGRSHNAITDTWPAPFIQRDNELNTRITHPDGSFDWESFKTVSRRRSEIHSDFAKELRSRIGSEFALKIRAYAHARSGRSPRSTAQMQILEALGFSLSRKVTKTPTVPRKKYDEALNKLRRTAAILNDEQLKRNVYHIDEQQHEQLKTLDLGKLGQLSLTELSSGAAALIHQFSSIEMACTSLLDEGPYTNLVLMIDEGDAFLHLAWQQRYVDYLDKTAALLRQKFKTVQIIVATHSPVLMSDFPQESTFILDGRSWFEDLIEENTPRRPNESFGAPLDAVVREVGQTGTMGTFAARIIKSVVDDISSGTPISPERIEMIGDPIIRRQINKKLIERGLLERKI